jgi:hypothetical protein
MNKWLEVLIGLIFLSLAIYIGGTNLFGFGQSALITLKGGLIWLVSIIGLILLILGITELKE